MTYHKEELQIGDVTFTLETGRMAKQAEGSATVRMGDTMVLATVCSAKPRADIDFFPLSVEYIEKTYAAGKIPGGFFKREGKPSEKEILSARLVDRPVRPLFPNGFNNELQIVATVVSADDAYDADVLAINAASCALCLAESVPFQGPIAGVRVGMVEGNLKIFPTLAETEAGMLDLIVAGSQDSIVMVEGGAYEVKEELIIEAILLAHEEIKRIVAAQNALLDRVGRKTVEFSAPTVNQEIVGAVDELIRGRLHGISFLGQKKDRYRKLAELLKETKEQLAERFPEGEKEIEKAFHGLERDDIRTTILETGTRIGGRGLDTVRDITIDLDILPRAHGSALFTRGETQALATTTLGTKLDEQRIDTVQSEYSKTYMLHYNFPPYSVGEVKRMGGASRREIGHGHLAERSMSPVLPSEKSFPYTIRIVSDVLESNGSSSMASVCGGSLSLMAAGVPIKSHVAGVAMGLIKEGDKVAILTDILGTEDHLGDMDFKVTGTREGVTAIQMDIKLQGLTADILREAMAKAHAARHSILDTMEAAIARPRSDLSRFAPRVFSLQIDKEKIREVIGPGGKVVREIQEKAGVTVAIEDDGTINVFAANKDQRDKAVQMIRNIVAEPEMGAVYDATVKTIVDFGIFVEFMPGREGLVHISELDTKRVGHPEDVVSVGDAVKVKLIGIDRSGKVKLSRKALLTPPAE